MWSLFFRYLKISMTETMPILNQKITIATQRVLFLLDCTLLPTEDIQLNTRVFQWPKARTYELEDCYRDFVLSCKHIIESQAAVDCASITKMNCYMTNLMHCLTMTNMFYETLQKMTVIVACL